MNVGTLERPIFKTLDPVLSKTNILIKIKSEVSHDVYKVFDFLKRGSEIAVSPSCKDKVMDRAIYVI